MRFDFGMIIRRAALKEKGIEPDALQKALEWEPPWDETEDLLSIGPCFGQEALDEYGRRFKALGLEWVDDYFEQYLEHPDWLAFSAREVKSDAQNDDRGSAITREDSESTAGGYGQRFDPRETLRKYADDTEVEIKFCDGDELVLKLRVDSCGWARWLMTIRRLVHLDLPPSIMLGRVEFGGIELVPDNYFASRNRGSEGDENTYHVIKFIDQDDNEFLVVSYEEAEIVF